MAAFAFLVGALGSLLATGRRGFLAAAIMAVLFLHAARMAMVTFDPYLSSRPLAEALLRAPEGKLIVDHPYYAFSSIFFYTNRTAPLLNGRRNNLVYGYYVPGAPDIFIDDQQWRDLWTKPERCYLIANRSDMQPLQKLVGRPGFRSQPPAAVRYCSQKPPLKKLTSTEAFAGPMARSSSQLPSGIHQTPWFLAFVQDFIDRTAAATRSAKRRSSANSPCSSDASKAAMKRSMIGSLFDTK